MTEAAATATAATPTVLREERDGDVAILVLANAKRLNPMGQPLQNALRERLRALAADRSVRALVITADGRGFCVGADLSAMNNALGGDAAADTRTLGDKTADTMHAASNRLISDIRRLTFPVVSAINGACAGAGVGLALSADIVVAARSAYFYLPFMVKLGIVPDLGTTWFLERLVGRGRATALTLLGEKLPAEKAVEWGIAWACVDDEALRDEALKLAHRLAALPPQAALETRRAYDAAAHNSLDAQMGYEAERQRELIDAPSFAEGVQAFIGKREPRFSGRS